MHGSISAFTWFDSKAFGVKLGEKLEISCPIRTARAGMDQGYWLSCSNIRQSLNSGNPGWKVEKFLSFLTTGVRRGPWAWFEQGDRKSSNSN